MKDEGENIVWAHGETLRRIRISRIKSRQPNVNITVGALDQQDVYNAFYDVSKRRLFRVTTDGIEISMKLVENIDSRKQLLRDKKILTNPYNFTDI